MTLLTKAQRREIRKALELIAPKHEWVISRENNKRRFYQCPMCGWVIALKFGATHNGRTKSTAADLETFLPILNEKHLNCKEMILAKVMES